MELKLNQISYDRDLMARQHMNTEIIGEYCEAMKGGEKLPPVTLFHDGTEYWLADGYHRLAAAKNAKLDEIEVDIRRGSRREAMLYAVGANTTHGLRRTNADKRKVVLLLLMDKQWHKWSDRKIAKQCAVSHTFVAKLRGNVATDLPHVVESYQHKKRFDLAMEEHEKTNEERRENARNSPRVRNTKRLLKSLDEKDLEVIGHHWLRRDWCSRSDVDKLTLGHELFRSMGPQDRAKFLAWIEEGCPKDPRVQVNLALEKMNRDEYDAIRQWMHEDLGIPLEV